MRCWETALAVKSLCKFTRYGVRGMIRGDLTRDIQSLSRCKMHNLKATSYCNNQVTILRNGTRDEQWTVLLNLRELITANKELKLQVTIVHAICYTPERYIVLMSSVGSNHRDGIGQGKRDEEKSNPQIPAQQTKKAHSSRTVSKASHGHPNFLPSPILWRLEHVLSNGEQLAAAQDVAST